MKNNTLHIKASKWSEHSHTLSFTEVHKLSLPAATQAAASTVRLPGRKMQSDKIREYTLLHNALGDSLRIQ